jgi:2-oxoglutarate dehydrogenase E1 component
MPDTAPSPDASSLCFAEDLYLNWVKDPQSVSPDWRTYFESLPRDESLDLPQAAAAEALPGPAAGVDARGQESLDQLVRAYRVRGHMIAKIDPLGQQRPDFPELDPAFHGFGSDDMEQRFSTERHFGASSMTLSEILDKLRTTYCRSIGVQFMHIDDLRKVDWLLRRMEQSENRLQMSRDEQVRTLERLTDAVLFEEFVQKKFLGAKSFSLQGSESLIPLLDNLAERASEHGVRDIVLGMAHRGRLNVLANFMGKGARQIFREFADVDGALYLGGGDVKYHLGHTSTHHTRSGAAIQLSLCFNPSHLEFVNTVAQGRVRAHMERLGDTNGTQCMAVLIHGDAAFGGQGIVQETLNLSQLDAYQTGGTIHVIVNNQIGFTTDPQDGRSTTYCTDVAKMLQIPIFHVNGEDPEAVAQVVRLAIDFRAEFHTDVVIDMYAYRKLGHNEGDEPAFTQPVLYAAIRSRKPVREGYLDHLLAHGELTREDADRIAEERRLKLEAELDASKAPDYKYQREPLGPEWSRYKGGADAECEETPTKVERNTLSQLLLATTATPHDFEPNAKIAKLLETRAEMARGDKPLDWAMGELAAYSSLAAEGWRVRMTGQDVERGTFSHRHAVLRDTRDGHRLHLLRQLGDQQADALLRNSPLSETGVLGFEYGYTLDAPNTLVVWEAQFGDFNNVAQVIIDQFIVSAEAKWKRLSGLVMLLPHGFEGQGPEHSSARLERFLQQCAGDNIQVVNLTTPAQVFHCLRRQVVRAWRKPLIVMSPKSLLRHPKAVSPLADFSDGHFQRIIGDNAVAAEGVTRVLLCSGKIYYELVDQREKLGRTDVAIVRLEQLHPLQERDLSAALAPYTKAQQVRWVQEEPRNMGAWQYLYCRFGTSMCGRTLDGITRDASASPATGSPSAHKMEQQQILDAAFA